MPLNKVDFQPLEPLTATGSDQSMVLPAGRRLVIRCKTSDVEIRDTSGATAVAVYPQDAVSYGPGPLEVNKTIYLKATTGAVIYRWYG